MGIGRNVDFILIVDECSGKVFIEFLRSKSEVGAKLKSFQRCAERHFQEKLGKYMVPHTLSCVRSDNAMENICAEVREGLDADGIRHELSSVYCQWQDGKSERFIRIY
jgi:transposase InsO family protein